MESNTKKKDFFEIRFFYSFSEKKSHLLCLLHFRFVGRKRFFLNSKSSLFYKRWKNIHYWSLFQLPWLNFYFLVIFPQETRILIGSIIFCNSPTLRKKRAFFWNKQKRRWRLNCTPIFTWFLRKNLFYKILILLKENIYLSVQNSLSIGTLNLRVQTIFDLINPRFLSESNVGMRKSFFRYNLSIQIVKQYWYCTNIAYETTAILHFITKRATEIYQNLLSQEFFLLPINRLKSFVYPLGRRPLYLGFWQNVPSHVTGKIGPKEIGQRISIERNVLILRQGTRVLLEADRFLPWKSGSIIRHQSSLIVIRGLNTETGDITSGIPRIESLLEVRVQTGVPFFLNNLYQYFLKKGFPNGVATRKSLHIRQRILVDGVQRNYRVNGVVLNDKHLELIVFPIAFAKVLQDRSRENPIVQGEDHPLEVLERTNWFRALKNWREKKIIQEGKSKVFYKPQLFGLTKGALRNASFLSAASFQETSRVLSIAALRGRIDFLFGLKENLVLGTRIPIGTNANFFTSNFLSKDCLIQSHFKIDTLFFKKTEKVGIPREKRLFWLDALCYLEEKSSQ